MKKILYLLLTLFGCTLLANGQDFKPGQQAQGILESKNVTVDHATGTFHYRVPLYTLESGAFELPVTLDYTARGVRVDDQPGPVGYNWTLNTGGVVTRTVRGGMADELSGGYAHSESAITPLWDDVTNVNLHRRDGESDIFTAVFNGRSVNFLIRKKANGTLYAEPLELTAVKIEPVSDWSGISAWTVTDEMGNRYLFEEQEYVKDLNKVDAISTNGVYDMSYVSAWYLSRIEPVNTAPITFIYEKGDPYGDLSAYMRKSHYNVYTSVHYDYGREMVEYPCDFGKYQEKYLKYLSQAKDALQSSVRDIKKVQELESMYGLRWFTNSTAAKSFAEYQRATRSALGCISDLRLLHSSSLKEVGALTQLIDYYHDENYLVSIYLTNARQCILDCLAERRTYRSKETQNNTYYDNFTPVLKEIRSPEQSLRFTYVGNRLETVSCHNLIDGKSISAVSFSGKPTLDKLVFKGKDNIGYRQMTFDYYQTPGDTYDPWGYTRHLVHRAETYAEVVDTARICHRSLKRITLPHGGVIELSYECNHSNCFRHWPLPTPESPYGGIRLSALVMQADATAKPDTIRYTYPEGGEPVYDWFDMRESIDYGDFHDLLLYTRMKNKGCAFLNTGNNGLYYPYVIETIQGKGSTAYLFNIPTRRRSYLQIPYAFWLYGLPLATATYDAQGHIRTLKKNVYYTDVPNTDRFQTDYLMSNQTFFDTQLPDYRMKHSKQLRQLQPYECYMDAKKIEKEYAAMPKTVIPNLFAFDPYEELYKPNMLPRSKVVMPDLTYTLYYGGSTLLKEQQEFVFEGHVTDSISKQDFYRLTQGKPFKRTEYFYSLSNGITTPAGQEVTDSRGVRLQQGQERVGDFRATTPVLDSMQVRNMLAQPLREWKKEGSVMLEETHYRYGLHHEDSCTFITLDNRLKTLKNSPLSSQPTATTLSVSYTHRPSGYLPVSRIEDGKRTSLCYHDGDDRIVLKAEEIFPDEMAVLDLQQQQQDLKEMDRVLSEQPADFYGEAATFLSCLRKIDWDTIQIRSLLPYQVTYLRRDMPKLFRLLECLSEPQSPVTKSEADTIINVAQGPLMFMNRLYRELVNHAAFEPVRQTYMAILFHLDRQLTPEVLYYSYWYHRNEVKVNARSNTRWSIYTLGEAPELTCTFVCGDGEHTVKIKPHNTGIPSCYLLDSGGLQDVRSLRIHVPSTVYYLAILPQRATFEAKTYNADGTVAVKFGPDGQSESYRYDAAGRVNSISNRDGKLIKTIIYTDPVNQ